MRGGKRDNSGRKSGWGTNVKTVAVRVPEEFVSKIEVIKEQCFKSEKLEWPSEGQFPPELWSTIESLERQICSQKVVEQRLVDTNVLLNKEKEVMKKRIEELEERPVTSGSVDSDSVEPVENLVVSLTEYIVSLEKTIEEMRKKLLNAQEVGKTALKDLDKLTEDYEQLQRRIGLPEDF